MILKASGEVFPCFTHSIYNFLEDKEYEKSSAKLLKTSFQIFIWLLKHEGNLELQNEFQV